jgi:hypothetical protein
MTHQLSWRAMRALWLTAAISIGSLFRHLPLSS